MLIKEPYLLKMVRRARESGEALVMADQSISSLVDVVKSNIYLLVCFCQSSAKDKTESIRVLGLDKEQAFFIDKLEPGQAIMKLAGRYPYPILVAFRFVTPVNMTEEEIDEINYG